MIWIGETVSYQKKNAILIDIDFPFVVLHTGKEKPIRARYDTVKKINNSGMIYIQNN